MPISDSTAASIAAEEKCSPKHVKNCATFAKHIDIACSSGLDFLKWRALTERIKYNRKLVAELIDMGAGGCQDVIEDKGRQGNHTLAGPCCVGADGTPQMRRDVRRRAGLIGLPLMASRHWAACLPITSSSSKAWL